MEVIAFIKNYWQYIAVVVLALLELVSIIVKKRPKSIDEFDDCVHLVLNSVARWVSFVEQEHPNFSGAKKKQEVISSALRGVSVFLGRSLTTKETDYITSLVCDQIETVMLAPTKKGGLGREKTI